MPDLANVHFDTALSNVSIAYTNEEYIADMVFPVVPVPKRSGKYFIYKRDTFLKSSGVDAQGKPVSIRRPGARSIETIYDLSNQPYYAEQLARNFPVQDADVILSDNPLMPAIDATENVMQTLLLDNEIQVANKVGKRGNYATANKVQLVNGTTSWAAASGKPMSVDIPNGKKAVVLSLIKAPNTMLVNYASAITLSQNAEYIARLQYVSKEGLTLGGLVPIVEGLNIIEALPQKVTSADGAATLTSGYVWVDDQATPQNTALIYYRNPAPARPKTIALGLTFDAPDDTLGAHGFPVKRWREEWGDLERVEVRCTRDWRFVATDGSSSGDNSNGFASAGYLVSGVDL